MDLQKFVESLSIEEIRKLSDLIYDARKNYARATAAPVNPSEAQLVYNGQHIAAIKAYRERLRCDLMTAKAACDVYRDKLIAEQVAYNNSLCFRQLGVENDTK